MLTIALLVACLFASSGCVRRTLSVTSDPSGALVWLNGREIGRTPVDVDFTYYGTYDVQLVADGCEPLLTTGQANAPWWDNIPLDLAAEITPGQKRVKIAWHYELQPRDDDPAALHERARQLRARIIPPPSQTQPQAQSQPSVPTAPTGSAPAAP